MKWTTWRWILTAAALAGAGGWTWTTVRHARLDLVTVNVRDVPLARVLALLERQTRERLVADRALAGDDGVLIHLQLRRAPLAEALALIAEQTGGFWRTTYAVHEHARAIPQLTSLLQHGVDPTAAGWTNLTGVGPDLPPPGPPDEPIRIPLGSGGEVGRGGHLGPAIQGEPGAQQGMWVEADETVVGPPPPQGLVTESRDIVAGGRTERSEGRRVPPGSRTTRRVVLRGVAADGGQTRIVDLSPERLLLEERLIPRLNDRGDLRGWVPSPEDAERIARAVKGRWSALYSLEPLPFPGMAGEMRRTLESGEESGMNWQSRSDAAAPVGAVERSREPADLIRRAEDNIRRRQLDRIERLTPEQRAHQAARASRGGEHRGGEVEAVEAVEAVDVNSATGGAE